MKVILREDVRKLGKKDEIIEVSDGYARNYLLPRGLADEATSVRIRELKDRQKVLKTKDRKKQAEAEKVKTSLQGKRLTIKVSAGKKGKLFGSVTTAQVVAAMKERMDTSVDKKDVKISDSIRQTGEYPFAIRLYPGIEVEMTLSVEAEQA